MQLVGQIVAIILGLGVPASLAFLFTFYTEAMIRWLSRSARSLYKEHLNLSDAQIDKIPTIPIYRLFIDSRSRFVNEGEKNPASFQSLIILYKLFGFTLWFITLLVAFGVFLLYCSPSARSP